MNSPFWVSAAGRIGIAGRICRSPVHKAPLIPVAVLLALLRVPAACAQEENPSDAAFRPGDEPLLSSPTGADPAGEGEDPVSGDRPYWRQNVFGRFFRDQKYLFTTWWPSEFHRAGFTIPIVAGIALATTSSRGNGERGDLELQNYVQSETRGRGQGVARGFSFIGDAAAGVALIGSSYLIGRWSHHDRLAEASSLSAEALLTAGLWSSALKAITARTRPRGESRGEFFDYNAPPGQEPGSFPSGHATGAFTVATVFASVYHDHRWVSWVAYSTAGLISASRVALGRHFPSDVIVGGLLGNSFGRMVLAHQQESRNSTSSFHPLIDPSQRMAGFVWTRRW